MVRPCLALAFVLLSLSTTVARADTPTCEPDNITVGPLQLGERGTLRYLEEDATPLAQLRYAPSKDHTPPPAPQMSMFHAWTSGAGDDAWFKLEGVFSPDTAFIVVKLTTGQTSNFFVTTPDRLEVCSAYAHLTPERTHVEITAYDLAGNRSPAFETDTIVANAHYYSGHVRCGMGALAYLFVIPVVLILLLVVLLILSMRQTRIRKMSGEPVSILLGESVARMIAKLYVVKSIVGVLATMALLELDYTVTGVMVALVSALWLLRLMRAGRVVARFEKPVNRLERREDWLMVDHTLLYCGRRAWNRAARVPTASAALQRRD